MALTTSEAVQAYAFRELVRHLQMRTDVQNIDQMNLAGYCRNCLSKEHSRPQTATIQVTMIALPTSTVRNRSGRVLGKSFGTTHDEIDSDQPLRM
eukprot:1327189-Amorphochlora_amoeboformis.AAC.2